MVVFNLEVTHAALFALKTTTAYTEEPKKEKLTWKAEENGKIIDKNIAKKIAYFRVKMG